MMPVRSCPRFVEETGVGRPAVNAEVGDPLFVSAHPEPDRSFHEAADGITARIAPKADSTPRKGHRAKTTISRSRRGSTLQEQ